VFAVVDQIRFPRVAPLINGLLERIEAKSVRSEAETRQRTMRRAKTSMTNAT
jgi:hypothetical protein